MEVGDVLVDVVPPPPTHTHSPAPPFDRDARPARPAGPVCSAPPLLGARAGSHAGTHRNSPRDW